MSDPWNKYPPPEGELAVPPAGLKPGSRAYADWAVEQVLAGKRLPQVSDILVGFPKVGTKITPMTPEQIANRQPSENVYDENGRQLYKGGVVNNATAGANGFIRDVVGGTVDRAQNTINWGIVGANALTDLLWPPEPSVSDVITGRPLKRDLLRNVIRTEPFGGTASINKLYDTVGINRPENVIADDPYERVARGAGEGVAAMLVPELMLASAIKAGAVTPVVAETLAPIFGRSESAGTFAKNAFVGGVSGGGAVVGTELASDELDPLASLGGGMIASGVGTVVAEAPTAVLGVARDFVAPFTQMGRERLAGEQLRDAATNPRSLIAAIDNGQPLVEGSRPTTFQITGDDGLGSLERVATTRDPHTFDMRRQEQTAARMTALQNIQPTGDVDTVVATLRSRLADIDQTTQGAVDAATSAARDGVLTMGLGRTPEVAGKLVREALETALGKAKTQEQALWRAVDPDGTLLLPVLGTKQQGARITGELPASAKPPMGEEAAIYGALGRYGDVMPFSELTALQSRIRAELRAERIANGDSPAYDRLTQLDAAVQRDLDSAVAQKVMQERQAVAAGQMRAEDALETKFLREREAWIAARASRAAEYRDAEARAFDAGAERPASVPGLRGAASEGAWGLRGPSSDTGISSAAFQPNVDAPIGDRSLSQRDAWTTDRGFSAGSPGGSGARAFSNGDERSTVVLGPPGAQDEGVWGLTGSSRHTGVSPEAFRPNLNDAAIDRLTVAQATTRKRNEAFDNPTLSPILERSTAAGPYDLSPSTVPERIFFSGHRASMPSRPIAPRWAMLKQLERCRTTPSTVFAALRSRQMVLSTLPK